MVAALATILAASRLSIRPTAIGLTPPSFLSKDPAPEEERTEAGGDGTIHHERKETNQGRKQWAGPSFDYDQVPKVLRSQTVGASG